MIVKYKSLGSVKTIKNYWTDLLEKNADVEIDVDDNRIIKSMIAMLSSEMDRYVMYGALEKANKKRINPSGDLTKLSENIMNYLKDLMHMTKGIDFGDTSRNTRQVFLVETLNIFNKLKPDAKKQFEQFIDGEIAGGSEDGSKE